MEFEETGFDGLYVVKMKPIVDDRGHFFRSYCAKEFNTIGVHEHFVQMNQSYNREIGTLRGMHAQTGNAAEIKFVRCLSGKVFDVVVDLRKDSVSYLKYFGIELFGGDFKGLLIPKGFVHGFITLEENSVLLYHHTAFYTPQLEMCIRYNDPAVGIQWPEAVRHVSEKDLTYPLIDQNFKGLP